VLLLSASRRYPSSFSFSLFPTQTDSSGPPLGLLNPKAAQN